jgi:hypothetical protein
VADNGVIPDNHFSKLCNKLVNTVRSSKGIPLDRCDICGGPAQDYPTLSRKAASANGGVWMCKPCINGVLAALFVGDIAA